LATYLIDRYNLQEKHIVEIGCGKGEFLTMLCELGNNWGTGFDPSYSERHVTARSKQVAIVSDFYSERYFDSRVDFICCRHVLEHVDKPLEFIKDLRRIIRNKSSVAVFFEVPSVSWILRNVTFWDIFYEHPSYFSPGSLIRLFEYCGFKVVSVKDAFGGQYLWLEAMQDASLKETELSSGIISNPQELGEDTAYFTAQYRKKMELLRQELVLARKRGSRCVIWGAGAKGVAFLNALDIQPELVQYVVDINPRKQGMYVPGTEQQIVPPCFLKAYAPDVILVMNPNYFDEVRETIASMSVTAELILL
jgi:SAM-dependent methyltransferase